MTEPDTGDAHIIESLNSAQSSTERSWAAFNMYIHIKSKDSVHASLACLPTYRDALVQAATSHNIDIGRYMIAQCIAAIMGDNVDRIELFGTKQVHDAIIALARMAGTPTARCSLASVIYHISTNSATCKSVFGTQGMLDVVVSMAHDAPTDKDAEMVAKAMCSITSEFTDPDSVYLHEMLGIYGVHAKQCTRQDDFVLVTTPATEDSLRFREHSINSGIGALVNMTRRAGSDCVRMCIAMAMCSLLPQTRHASCKMDAAKSLVKIARSAKDDTTKQWAAVGLACLAYTDQDGLCVSRASDAIHALEAMIDDTLTDYTQCWIAVAMFLVVARYITKYTNYTEAGAMITCADRGAIKIHRLARPDYVLKWAIRAMYITNMYMRKLLGVCPNKE